MDTAGNMVHAGAPAPADPANDTKDASASMKATLLIARGKGSPRRLTPAMALPSRRPKAAYRPEAVFTWRRACTYLLSERTLNVLLGLGSFLILTAAVVISTVNPTGLGPLPHFMAMLCTTLVFYIAGVCVQARMTMARTGATLLAIGAAFIPLDLCTFGQDVLALAPRSTWLFASALCLPIYLLSHYCLYTRTSAILAAVSGCSLVLALTYPLGLAPIWGSCALVGLAGVYMVLAHRLRTDWANLSGALLGTAQLQLGKPDFV